MFWVYSISNKVNGKRYIGVTNNIKSRWSTHRNRLLKGNHVNKYLQSDYNKYGVDNFVYEILEEISNDCSDDYVADREIYYISKYNSCDEGYNMTYGGDGYGRRIMSDVLRKEYTERISNISKNLWNQDWFRNKMLELNKGNKYNLGKHASEETRKKISDSRIGEKNPFYGKHHTEESKQKMKEKLKDYYNNEENMAKHKEAISKFIHSEEYRNKQSKLSSGRSNKTSELDALNIRYRYLCGEKPRFILKDFPKLTSSGLKKICQNVTWKHLPNTKEELYNMLINYQTNQE